MKFCPSLLQFLKHRPTHLDMGKQVKRKKKPLNFTSMPLVIQWSLLNINVAQKDRKLKYMEQPVETKTVSVKLKEVPSLEFTWL